MDGIDAASKFLIANRYSRQMAELVWDAIALHSSASIVERKAPPMSACCTSVSTLTIDGPLALYPLPGMKKVFETAVAEVTRKSPHCELGNGLVDIGRVHVHGFDCPNVCDLIDAAPYESWVSNQRRRRRPTANGRRCPAAAPRAGFADVRVGQ
ncbi:MAG: hypothetical protein ACJ8HI_14700 [Massilia sp.]